MITSNYTKIKVKSTDTDFSYKLNNDITEHNGTAAYIIDGKLVRKKIK